MATSNKKTPTRTTIDELNEKLSSAEQHVESNKKIITYTIVAILVVIGLGAGWYYGIHQKNIKESITAVGSADVAAMSGDDSLALNLYKKAAADYSGKYANRANLEASILLYKQGKWADALKSLEAYSTEESLVGALAQTLKGDCNVNLKKYDDAISCYEKAVGTADGNKYIAPYAMYKKAVVLTAQNKHKEAADIYKEIKDKFPAFANQAGMNISKLYEQEAFRADNK